MPIYGYNYPWSGRLGRIGVRCIYCGDTGPSFQYSSAGCKCTKCPGDAVPIPEYEREFEAIYDQQAREWCLERGIDYEATVQNYLEHLGPPRQERDEPIPGADQDYSVPIASLILRGRVMTVNGEKALLELTDPVGRFYVAECEAQKLQAEGITELLTCTIQNGEVTFSRRERRRLSPEHVQAILREVSDTLKDMQDDL